MWALNALREARRRVKVYHRLSSTWRISQRLSRFFNFRNRPLNRFNQPICSLRHNTWANILVIVYEASFIHRQRVLQAKLDWLDFSLFLSQEYININRLLLNCHHILSLFRSPSSLLYPVLDSFLSFNHIIHSRNPLLWLLEMTDVLNIQLHKVFLDSYWQRHACSLLLDRVRAHFFHLGFNIMRFSDRSESLSHLQVARKQRSAVRFHHMFWSKGVHWLLYT